MATDWSKLEPFYVGVPHQRRPFVVSTRAAETHMAPEDSDEVFRGDHDLSGTYYVETQQDAEHLMDPRDPKRPGGEIRHQGLAVAMLVRKELELQGVLEQDDEESNDD